MRKIGERKMSQDKSTYRDKWLRKSHLDYIGYVIHLKNSGRCHM